MQLKTERSKIAIVKEFLFQNEFPDQLLEVEYCLPCEEMSIHTENLQFLNFTPGKSKGNLICIITASPLEYG